MKHVIWITLLLAAVSCKKKADCNNGKLDGTEVKVDCGGSCTPCAIEYPETGTYGTNVLHGNDTIKLSGNDYSFSAIIPEGSSLKIELNHISGTIWGYSLGTNIGWSITDYESGTQTFDAINGGTTELGFVRWTEDDGAIRIKYFENGTTVTKDKVLIWE